MLRLALAAALALAAPQDKDKKPSEAELLAQTKAPAGFKVTIFAAPPDVGYPTCVAVAPTGELFVGIDENGSIDAKPGRGRIVRCVDTDGDGRADRFTVFAANVDSPRGLVWDAGRLHVLHPPCIRTFFDEDGDGVAERSEIVVQGLGFDLKFRGADHTTNGMALGVDGWLYIAVGDYGFVKAQGRDGGSAKLMGGGVARVRPDGSELEVFATGLRNIYDVALSPELDAFTRDNTNDGGGWNVRLSHVIPSGVYGYPSLFQNFADEIVAPLADYGGGSPCGSLFVDEPGLGRALYTCDWGRSIVYRHSLEPRGAGFKAGQQTFVEMPRPTDMDVDASGRVYLASWRNGMFTYAGPNVGYVARVVSGDAKPAPELRKASDDELVKHLAAPGAVLRLQAQREILRRGAKVSAGIEALAAAPGPLPARIAGLFTLKQLQGARSHETLLRLAKDPALRESALRALADRKGELSGVPIEPFIEGLRDSDPRVRLQAAAGLGRLGKPEGTEALLGAAADPDPLVAHAAVRSLVSLRPIEACLKAGNLRVLQEIHDPRVVDGLLPKIDDPAVLKALCRLHSREADWEGKWWGTRPDTSGPYFKPVAWSETPRIAKALQEALDRADVARAKVLLVELRRHKIALEGTTARLLKLAAEDASFRPVAADLVAQGSTIPPEAVPLLEGAASSDTDARLRARALGGLLKLADRPEALEAAVRVLSASKLPDELKRVREEFLRDARHAKNVPWFVRLASASEPGRRDLAWGVLLHAALRKETPREAKEAVDRAVEAAWKTDDAALILRAIGAAKLDAWAHAVRLHQKDSRPAVRDAALAAAKELKLDRPSQGTPLKGLSLEKAAAAALAEKGDAKLGAQLYLRQGCNACHTVAPGDPPRGPFLGDVAARYGRAEILESILAPNAKIAQGFTTHGFLMRSGASHEGFIVRESGDEVEIRDLQGVATVLPLKDIDKRVQRETSMMPSGLADPLTAADLASLLAYLESLRPK